MASQVQLVNPLEATVDQDSSQQTHTQIYKLGFIDSIKFSLYGNVKVGHINRGKNRLEAYLFKCDVHGLQVTSPSGHYELLLCPECLKERHVVEAHNEKSESNRDKLDSDNPLSKYLTKNIRENK